MKFICDMELAEQFGTPLYVIDEEVLVDSVNKINNAFNDFPAPVHIAYPYKTNSLAEICKFMQSHGRWAEVASKSEIEKALSFNIDPDKIIYNSPYKNDDSIRYALQLGCKLHIDNFPELNKVMSLQSEINRTINIGLRLSTKSNIGWDRFGFDIDGEAEEAIVLINQTPKIRLSGFHTHQSNIGNISSYEILQTHMLKFMSFAINRHSLTLDYIDLGSGFAITWPKPKTQKNWDPPNISEYSRILGRVWLREKIPGTVSLVIEPGRLSVSSAGYLLTRVTSIKKRSSKIIVSVDSGHNLVPGVELYDYNILNIRANDNEQSNEHLFYEIYGTLCDSFDLLGSDIALYELSIGDVISIRDIGGYDMARSFSWQISRPPLVWLDSHGRKRVLSLE